MTNFINRIKKEFFKMLEDHSLLNENIEIEARTLTPEEAIGNPDREDFPLLKGKERIMEAKFKNSIGQVFTDMPGNFKDTLKNILEKKIRNNFHRAVLIASINAVMRELNLIKGTIHCKNNEPEDCALKVISYIKENYEDKNNIALIGYQPAFVEKLGKNFSLKVLDLNKDNFGKRYGITVFDSSKYLEKVLKTSELVLTTGTVFVNNTIEEIVKYIDLDHVIFYGVTVAGISKLLNLKRVCYYSK